MQDSARNGKRRKEATALWRAVGKDARWHSVLPGLTESESNAQVARRDQQAHQALKQ